MESDFLKREYVLVSWIIVKDWMSALDFSAATRVIRDARLFINDTLFYIIIVIFMVKLDIELKICKIKC